MNNQVTMRCPDCGKEVQSPRDPTDYPETQTIVVQCDECDDGDFHEAFHLDADGKHITRDPMEPAHPAPASVTPARCSAAYPELPKEQQPPGPGNPPVWCYLPAGHEGPHRCNYGGSVAPFVMDERKVVMRDPAPARGE